MFGLRNRDNRPSFAHYMNEVAERRKAENEREQYIRAYLDLRHALTALCCRNGVSNPTLEPLASILKKHDARMESRGYLLHK